MIPIKERVASVLEHYKTCIVKCNVNDTDNIIGVDNTTPKHLKNYLNIVFGERVSKGKVQGGFEISPKTDV